MIRRTLFWTHLTLGVIAGLAILVMSATGVVLAFERQILHLVDRDVRRVAAPPDAGPRSLGEMLVAVSLSAGAAPSGITVRNGATASVEFTFGDAVLASMDQTTPGVVAGADVLGSTGRGTGARRGGAGRGRTRTRARAGRNALSCAAHAFDGRRSGW